MAIATKIPGLALTILTLGAGVVGCSSATDIVSELVSSGSHPESTEDDPAFRYEGTELWTWHAENQIVVSPAVLDELIYLGSTDGRAYAIKDRGRPAWDSLAGIVAGSVAVQGEMVYVGSNMGISALNRATGDKVWTKKIKGGGCSPVPSAIEIADGRLFVANKCGKLHALRPSSGDELWSFETGERGPSAHGVTLPAISSPVESGGLVFIGSRTGTFFAVDAKNGQEMWSYNAPGPIVSTPALGADLVFFTSGGNESDMVSSPVYANGFVYVGATSPTLHALRASDGAEVWRADLGTNVATVGAYYAINGGEVWSDSMGPVALSTPAVDEHCVYIGNDDGMVWALERANGEKRWSFFTRTETVGGLRLDSHIRAKPAVAGGTVHITSENVRSRSSLPLRSHQSFPVDQPG